MLSLFKINDPYKILIVLIMAVMVQLPIILSGINITLPEIEWNTVGQKLAAGGELYVDIFYPIGPLSAQIYRLIAYISPDNFILYRILGLLLVIMQASILNFQMIRFKAYNQNTYVPSLIYVALMLGMEDFITLSPQLMGLSFVIPATGIVFKLIEGRRRSDEDFLKIGVLSGFSVLFYPLYIIFIFPLLIALLFFTNTLLRRYLVLIAGIALPVFLTWLKYYWYGQLDLFYFNLKFLFLSKNDVALLSWDNLLLLMIIPVLFLIYSFIRIMQSSAFVNYQVRLQKFYFLYTIFGLLIIIMDYHQASYILIVLIPVATFFVSHLFLMIKNTLISEIIFLTFLGLLIFQNLSISIDPSSDRRMLDFTGQYLMGDGVNDLAIDSRILVLGNDTRKYYRNRLATPYLSWTIFQNQVDQLDDYGMIIDVYENFMKDLPEMIIDDRKVMPVLLLRMPELAHLYRKGTGQTYVLDPRSH